ncbi:GNAT family protein [Bacillus sp. ISL-47]|uniref:GNAT family N-acetyltransferase n=1 Tax=Bacillus sp. ISL-47 TaxID=2819130 RepID=UPI001BE9F9B4|nr:GNAT family protein [Bacillus sp. ISL-47]MBT2708155.1 GNAT family N-acetyltransferase [Pseudomonas sp. ISL-84]
MNNEKIDLQKLCAEHKDALVSFELPEEQAQFTALPKEVLETREGQFPVVITKDDYPVGFFILHTTERVKEFTENPTAMLLTALSITFSQQGKGYAWKGMALLQPFLKKEFPHCSELVLAVNRRNIAAQKLYEKAGFQDTGRRIMGKKGEQYIYSYIIER